MRLVMNPNIVINPKEKSSNNMRDFLSLVDIYGYSHMITFTNTDKNSYMHLAKMPKGPTISFKINDFILASDIFANNTQCPLIKDFSHTPLMVMTGFNNEKIAEEYKTAITTTSMLFTSFFPPCDLSSINMKKYKRVVLINLNIIDNIPQIELRYYKINIEK